MSDIKFDLDAAIAAAEQAENDRRIAERAVAEAAENDRQRTVCAAMDAELAEVLAPDLIAALGIAAKIHYHDSAAHAAFTDGTVLWTLHKSYWESGSRRWRQWNVTAWPDAPARLEGDWDVRELWRVRDLKDDELGGKLLLGLGEVRRLVAAEERAAAERRELATAAAAQISAVQERLWAIHHHVSLLAPGMPEVHSAPAGYGMLLMNMRQLEEAVATGDEEAIGEAGALLAAQTIRMIGDLGIEL
ncbi:MAG TPA: hypothetical protein VGE07_23545 [Herpetosiphonaceae bacterium]